MRRALAGAILVSIVAAVTSASIAGAHPERDAYYPNFNTANGTFGTPFGRVPPSRPIFRKKGGKRLVVCKPDSKRRIKKIKGSKKAKRVRLANLRLLKRCKYRDIQAAVNASKNNFRIAVLPGYYQEKPSLKSPNPDHRCDGLYTRADRAKHQTLARGAPIPTEAITGSYEYHAKCPNSQNLIAVIGDSVKDPDRRCDNHCNLDIVGTGLKPSDVLISGQRTKLNVIKADRADGINLRNFTIENSDFNNIYVLETNGFNISHVVSRYSREYGVLTFVSDQGLIDHVEAYGSGDSGIYPGAGPEGHCKRYGIEVRYSDSHDNNIGTSGTAGNGTWYHDNKLHNNSTGATVDSFAGGHPGMPQDCSKWENNDIYSNNLNVWDNFHDEYCNVNDRPVEQRDPKVVCPTFQNPVGTGLLIAGGNGNIVRNNRIWDNWRDGVKFFWVPRSLRGDDPTGQSSNNNGELDTSLDNHFTGNTMGTDPRGRRSPNGNDYWWDGEGKGNCFDGNTGAGGGKVTSNQPLGLPSCPGSSVLLPANPAEQASQVACATWNPYDPVLHDPPGCDWFTPRPKPQ